MFFILSILRKTVCLTVSFCHIAKHFSPVRNKFVISYFTLLIFAASILSQALSVADIAVQHHPEKQKPLSQKLPYDCCHSASSSESAAWAQVEHCASLSLSLDICPLSYWETLFLIQQRCRNLPQQCTCLAQIKCFSF